MDAKSVAVLAFANLSDDKANEYFSDGISEELINVLAKVPGLRVIARTSAFSFKGRGTPVAEIARQLGVTYVIDGSVRKAGNQVRIITQLINAATGASLWSERYQRELKDVFAIQDEIAGAIAAQFKLTVNGEGATPAAAIDPEAYRLLLAGRAKVHEGGSASRSVAIDNFRRAVALAPKFAAAWAELARALIQEARTGTVALDPAFVEARAAVKQAVSLEPEAPEVLVALGWVRRTADWDWRGSERAFRRALDLYPDRPDVISGAAVMFNNLGHVDESIRLGRRAVELDPLNPEPFYNLSFFLGNADNLAECEQAARRAVELAPHADLLHRNLSNTLADLGRLDEAAREAEQEPDELNRIQSRALILVRRGRNAEALELAKALERGTNNLQDLAELHALAVDRDGAFAILDKALANRETGMAWMKVDSYLVNLHGDPRWDVILRKLNLADDQLK